MSIYYFNIRSDAFDADDQTGEDCADIDAARSGALVAAGELVRSELRRGALPCFGWIEVEDEHRRRVLTLPLRRVAS